MRNTVLKVFFSLLLVLFVVSCNEPDPTIPVAGVSLSKPSLEMAVGNKKELTATVTPAEATNKKVTWTTSDANVAEITDEGGGGLQVTAKAPGEALITVKTEDGGKTASCTVTVKAKIIPVESITLDQSEKTLNIGETVTLKATVSPENATNKNISWSSDKTDVATVDENGNVSANSVGTATIKATAGGKSATCTITVKPIIAVTKVSITPPDSTKIKYGEAIDLVATVEPEDATNKNLTWTSSDTTVATVDQNGRVAAQNKAGTATITVTTEDGGKTATCDITVEERSDVIPVINITLNETNKTINKGNSSLLPPSIQQTQQTRLSTGLPAIQKSRPWMLKAM